MPNLVPSPLEPMDDIRQLTVLSNDSSFPANTPSNFRSKLGKSIKFVDGKYLCGLQSVIFHHSISAIDDDYIEVYWTRDSDSSNLPPSLSPLKTPLENLPPIRIPFTRTEFEDTQHLVDYINTIIASSINELTNFIHADAPQKTIPVIGSGKKRRKGMQQQQQASTSDDGQKRFKRQDGAVIDLDDLANYSLDDTDDTQQQDVEPEEGKMTTQQQRDADKKMDQNLDKLADLLKEVGDVLPTDKPAPSGASVAPPPPPSTEPVPPPTEPVEPPGDPTSQVGPTEPPAPPLYEIPLDVLAEQEVPFYAVGDSVHHEVARGAHVEVIYDHAFEGDVRDEDLPYNMGDVVILSRKRPDAKTGTYMAPGYQRNVPRDILKDIERVLHASSGISVSMMLTGRIQVLFNQKLISHVQFSDNLSDVLGFGHRDRVYAKEVAKYTPDLKAGIHQFVIYEKNGLLDNTILGDQLTSVLRVVPVKGRPGETVEISYDSPVWIPVLATEIDELHFELRTLQNKPMPFQSGPITLTLVFKRALF